MNSLRLVLAIFMISSSSITFASDEDDARIIHFAIIYKLYQSHKIDKNQFMMKLESCSSNGNIYCSALLMRYYNLQKQGRHS